MSLEGAKFICLDEAGNHGDIILAKGRKFSMGYYVSCDFVLVDERAKGVHCEIECDAFGRVTIRNLSPDKPILVNGFPVEIKRILLNNSKLSILDKEYLWLFKKSFSNEFEDLPIEATSTPQKSSGIPEQPPNSCPDFKLHRDLPKRFTVHNFAYCIQSGEKGNISLEKNDANSNEHTESNQIHNKSEEMIQTKQVLIKDSSENTSQVIGLDKKIDNRNRSITPEPNNEVAKSTIELSETPKLNLINCTKDKENKSTENKNKHLLTKCHQSDLVITSFSPRETGVKTEKSFATIVRPKVLVTKLPSTPKSVYSTPKSDMYENDRDDENESELITFHTPSTSKKAPTGVLTPSAKPLKNSSMHLIDLTTPHKLRPISPYLKSALKASAKKNITQTMKMPCTKLISEQHLGFSALPITPIITITDATSGPSETPSSVISVDSSTDDSSIIELISDGSNMGITPGNAIGLNTPLKKQMNTGAVTPKRTPQSLIKRAILTSAKKQNTTAHIITKNPVTPRGESINRIPLRNNAAMLKTPLTPQVLTGNLSVSQLARRQSMSTPTRKSVSTSRLFDNSPSTSKLATATPSNSSKIARALPSSTPMSGSSNSSNFGQRSKTSSLYKVRKSLGGVPLSSHISKARKAIILSASASKITSIKEKSPQQLRSDRLIANARKSMCVTPNPTKTHNVTTAKTSSQKTYSSSILKDKTAQSTRKLDRKVLLFADKQPVTTREEDNLSRTFIIDSDEEKNTEIKKQKEVPTYGTLSPERDSNKIEKPTMKLEKEQPTIETPLDVEEVSDLTKGKEESKCENKNQTANEEKKSIIEECNREKMCYITESESHVDNKEINASLADSDRVKSIVTEESFAEVVNDSKEQNIMADTFEISNNPKESSLTESQESFAEAVENRQDVTEDLGKTSNQDINNKTDVAETGFGEESIEEISQKSHNENVHNKEDRDGEDILNKIENSNLCELQQETYAINIQGSQQHTIEVEKNTPINETKFLDAQELQNKVDPKGDEQKSYEYKPIVEDITLEESVIEKETKENDKINVSRQPLYEDITLEGSLIEEKIKSEEIKEENNKKVIKETTDNKPSSTITNVCEMFEPTENLPQPNTSETNILQAKEISTNINQKEDVTLVDETENEEKLKNNQDEMKLLETNQVDRNIEVKRQDDQFQLSEANNVNEDAVDENAESTVKRTEDFKASQSESQPTTIVENLLDDDAEDTNKLLEEIEDVLNKSDEIKQKQLTEQEKESETTLNDVFESEKLSLEKTETLVTNELEELTACDEKLRETSISKSPAQTIKLSKQEDKNENQATSHESELENSADNIAKMSGSTEENSTKETVIGMEENSEYKCQELNIISQLEDNKENTKSVLHEKSEAKQPQPINVIQNEKDEEDIPATTVFQSENIKEMTDSCDQKKAETKVTEETKQESGEDVPNQNEKREEKSEKQEGVDILTQNQDTNSFDNERNEAVIDGSNYQFERGPKNLEHNEGLNKITTKMENAVVITPRRSTRRASQSADTPQASAELSFTPRRSTRRASFSTEPTSTCTPTNKTTRRTSLSVVNETPLTPKSNIKRRSSISIDKETSKPCTSKTQRAKTPRKQLEQHMVIPEEINELVGAIILEEKEQLEEKDSRTTISYHDEPPKPSAIQIMSKQDETDKAVEVTLEEKIEPGTKTFVKNKSENIVLAGEILKIESTFPKDFVDLTDTDDIMNSVRQQDDIENIVDTQAASEKDSLPTEEKQIVITSNLNSDVALKTLEKQVTDNALVSEQKQEISDEMAIKADVISEEELNAEQENIESLTENASSNKISDAIEHNMERIIAQDVTNDNLEDIMVKGIDRSSDKQHEVDEMLAEDDISKYEEEHHNIAENTRENNKDLEISRLPEVSPSPTTSKYDNVTRDETKNIQTIVDVLEVSAKEVPETLTLGTEKSIEILHDSLKAPLMSGMCQLLKTTTATFHTPRLVGISDFVCTDSLGNKKEKSEDIAVVADLVKTPATDMLKISTPKSKKQVKIVAESPKTPLMAGIFELLKTPKPEAQTPRLEGIRDLVRTPRDHSENEQEEIEKLAVVANLIKTPVINVSEISTPTVKKHATIVGASPKTPLMTGMRELLKTPKAESQTPRLEGIRDLVRTPRDHSENEQEEIEKLAVVADLSITPVITVSEISTPKVKKHVTIVGASPNTPLMTGVRELLKTPKAESQTPRLEGISELVRTPRDDLQNEQEEINVSEISTPKTIKHITITADSPKSPLMTGMRELLKTPKAESRTPRLEGISELVRTPRDDLLNEQEEIKKSAVAADLIKTPVINVSEISTPKTKKHITITADSPKSPLMTGIRELLKTPKAESQTPRLGGIRTPRDHSENEQEEIEKLAVVANLIKTPVINVSEISTPTVKKHATIVGASPKTPLMTGMRELLKTPKAESQTPRLEDIRDLVRTPRDDLQNEQEEIEKSAVVADFSITPVITVSEISTPKVKKHVTIVGASPKTPLMTGVRELLKTPKAETLTPRLGDIRDLVRTPTDDLENEQEVIEKLAVVADLIQTPVINVSEISTPRVKKHVTIVADSPNTPLMAGMREMVKTPNSESTTPKLSGICNLVRTPKLILENDQETEKLALVAELAATPEGLHNPVINTLEEMPSTSMKSDNLRGVKELLKTPTSCRTPRLKGIRELMKTPKSTLTPITSGVKELLKTPVSQKPHDLQTSTVELIENIQVTTNSVSKESMEIISSTNSKDVVGTKNVKEQPKTPKSCSTPRELTQAPKMSSSTPFLTGIKDFMGSPAHQNDQELEQYLRTPRAKNIMIPSMPSSAVIEQSSDSIEISTEYDLNATNEGETQNLEELFKTPVASRFVDRMTDSYYGQEEFEHDATDDKFNKTKNESPQDTLNKSAKEAFDKLVAQRTQMRSPIRKALSRKSFTLQGDLLFDLSKTDVEEWIDPFDDAEPPPTIIECDDNDKEDENVVEQDINEIAKNIEVNKQHHHSFDESIIPETCTKVYLTENALTNKNILETKDPLSSTITKLKEKETGPQVTPIDAEMSGIDLLDQTVESVQDELSMLDEPLVVESSMFEEHLLVSDNESEAENTLEISQDECNELSEPLLLSDSEDLNLSQEANNVITTTTKNKYEFKQAEVQELQTSNLDIAIQEISLLEKLQNTVDLLAEDPLDSNDRATSVIAIEDENESLVEINEESIINKTELAQNLDLVANEEKKSFIATELPTEPKEDQKLAFEDCLIKDSYTIDKEIESVEPDTSEVLEVFSTSQITSTSQIDKTGKQSANNLEINLIIENTDAEIDAAETHVVNKHAKQIAIEETKVISNESENIYVDSSVTEICAETSIINEEELESKVKDESKKTTNICVDIECQNIFMDNSNIDESFADEAASEEHETVVSEVTTKTLTKNDSPGLSLPVEADSNSANDFEKEAVISDTEEVQIIKENETEAQHNDTNKAENPEETHELKQPTDKHIAEAVSFNENQIETKPRKTYKNELEYTEIKSSETLVAKLKSLDEKQVETESSDTTVIQLEPLDTLKETVKPKTPTKLLDITIKDITNDTILPTENFVDKKDLEHSSSSVVEEETKECISQDFPVFIDSPQATTEDVMSNDNMISECELPENEVTIPAESIDKALYESQKDLSIDAVTIENENPSEAVLTDTSVSIEVKNSDTVVYQKVEESSEAIDRINENKSNLNPQPQRIIENIAWETPTELEDNLKIDKLIGSPGKEVSSSSKVISITEKLPDPAYNEVRSLEYSSKTLTETTDVVKYDYKVKIIDTDYPKEKDTSLKESVLEIPECTKDTKPSLGPTLHCSQFEKDTKETEETRGEMVQEVRNVIAEESEMNDVTAARIVRKKRTISESSQESAQGEEHNRSSRRNRRKIIKKPIEQKFEEVEEIIDNQQITNDLIPDSIKKDGRLKRKQRTLSDSSQGSARDDEGNATTRRGGRRKIQKAPIETPVVEQKEEEEEGIPQGTVREEPKAEEEKEANKPITLTEKRSEKEQNTLIETATESNQHITPTDETTDKQQSTLKETVAESLNEAEIIPVEELIVKQSVETVEVLNENHVKDVTKQNEKTKDHKIEEQLTSTKALNPDEQKSANLKADVAGSDSNIETEEHLSAVQVQVSSMEEPVSSVSIEELKDETKTKELSTKTQEQVAQKKDLHVSASVKELLNIPQGSSTRAPLEDKIKEKENKNKNDALKRQSHTAVAKETTSKEDTHELKIEKLDEVKPKEVELSSFLNKNTSKQLKRGHCKQTASEPSQGYSQEDDDTKRTKMTQHKVQKTSGEGVAVQERLDDKEKTANETDEISLDAKPSHGLEQPIDSPDDQVVKNQNITSEIQEETKNLGRRKATVSESSQGSVHEDNISRTRRVRRKVQKTPIEEIMIEEKTSELKVSAETEVTEDVPSKLNDETEEILDDNAKNKTKSDEDFTKVSTLESKESIPDRNQASLQNTTLDPIEIRKNQHDLTEIAMIKDKIQEISKDHVQDKKSKEITHTRGRNKLILQEHVLEQPNTSRKSRRKVQVSTAKESNIESIVQIDSEIKASQAEFIKVSEVQIVTTVKEDQPVQEIVTASKKETLGVQTLHEPTNNTILRPETETITKQIGTRGRHYKTEVKESLNIEVEHEEDTIPKSSEKTTTASTTKSEKIHSKEVAVKEICAITNEELQNETKEPSEVLSTQQENNKETLEVDHSTKQTAKRGRLRKVNVEEDIKLDEITDESPTLHITRRVGRHKTTASETTTTALPKGRRNRKTPVEHSKVSNQQESADINEKQIEIADKIPSDVVTTTVEVSKVRSRSQNRKTPVDQPTTSGQQNQLTKEEQQIEPIQPIKDISADSEITNKLPVTVFNEENTESLENVISLGMLNNSTDEDLTTSKESEYSAADKLREETKNAVKNRVKRTRTGFESSQPAVVDEKPTKKRARRQIDEIEESHGEVVVLIDTTIISPQIQKNESTESHTKEVEIEKDIVAKLQKPTRRRPAPIPEIKSKRRRGAEHEESEKQCLESEKPTGDVLISEVKITEVNLEPEESLDQHASAEEENQAEVAVRKGRRKANIEDNRKKDQATMPSTKSKEAVKHDQDQGSSSTKMRIGRKKHIEEEDDKTEADVVAATSKRRNISKKKEELQKDDHRSMMKKEEQIQSKNKEPHLEKSEIDDEIIDAVRSHPKIRKKKAEHEAEDQHKQISEINEKVEQSTNIENSGAVTHTRNVSRKKLDLEEDHDDINVSGANLHPQEEPKKGRGRRQKNDEQASQSPETKHIGRGSKQSHTDTHDHITKVVSDENLTKKPETKLKIPSAKNEPKTPQSTASVAKRGRKVIEHITAESEEVEDTPGRKARNVPLRRAATAYHNYDETSDSEISTKIKKKIDSPRKSLDAVKTLPTATITSAPIIILSLSSSSTTPATTARGRTRKPTAKVQQFLEKERAKAETPKKRGLLAASAGNEAATPQLTPARRGRKPSTIETEVDRTPQASKGRGRGRPPASHSKEDTNVVAETKTVVEEKEIEIQTTPPPSNTIKGRRGGRKAKITEEESNNADQPPAKKSPLQLESEKQHSSPSVETPTPTRIAGRRNAAAAAKARIEEDALAAAAIEPPKRARAKKATAKLSSVLTAITASDVHSSEVEEEQTTKDDEKVDKNKNSSQTREHRLASASTIEGVADLEDEIEKETMDKPANKRGRKAAVLTTTNSPAVPVKKGRKGKNVDEAADPKAAHVEPKTSRGRGRGRKNVHFDEHNEAEASSTSQENPNDKVSAPVVDSAELAKKRTRTRRK